ncbi:4-hydroxybenzoate polyprenyltransferase [Acetobacteraceae bacterium]|nr:4-hydroxybenzoate polyprenyltransferase [Acetobacteraceae bacterium]
MPSPSAHSDIFLKGYIGRLPYPWRSYALLMRLDRPVAIWLLFQPCAFGVFLAPQSRSPWQCLTWLLFFLLGSFTMRSAGCIINDLWDRKFDALVERTKTRPLASGAVSVSQAVFLLGILLLISFGLLLVLPSFCWILGVFALLLTSLYPTAKRFFACPQLILGLTFGFGTLIAYAAMTETLSPAVISLYLGVVFWQMGYDTIYGFQDMKDDQKIGVKSASLLMRHHAKIFISACYFGTFLGFSLAIWLGDFLPLGAIALLPGMFLLFSQIVFLNPNAPATCLSQFKQNVLIGWLFVVGWGIERLLS